MEDLLPPQIKDSCKLALPEGLNDLMCDISREVLRHQPRDLYQFITGYLSALLITRDHLTVASYICSDICQCSCEPELQNELRDMGIPEADIQIAKEIIVKFFEEGPVKETNLLMKLTEETSISADMMPAVQDAIRSAYLRHQAHNTTKYESSSDSCSDEMMCAAKHTLDLYRKTAPSGDSYEAMAEKIQKSYRAFGVKRDCEPKEVTTNASNKPGDKYVTLVDPKTIPQLSNFDIAFPKTTCSEENVSEETWDEDQEIIMSSSMNKKRITTISSTSLAGSFMNLPSRKPYSAHECDVLSDLEEYPEREHAYIDYTADNPHVSMVTEDKLYYKKDVKGKKISFSESVPMEAKMMGLEVDDDSESRDTICDEMDTNSGMFYHGDDILGIATSYGDMVRSDCNLDVHDFDLDLM